MLRSYGRGDKIMENGMFNISTLLEKYIVYIPEIQRDYAQGRNNKAAETVRNKLLEEIYDVLSGKSPQLVLNYIYGVPDDTSDSEKRKIILIDGQQRVTTLFLLKWYLAKKSEEKDFSFLKRLNYATRESSEQFCRFLGEENPCIEGGGSPSENIENHPKFKKRWLNDPTIFNMLNMLDAIDKKIKGDGEDEKFVEFYSNLDNIKFSFISLDGFRRTEELYAAMNSRGKQLTPFELIKGKLIQADQEDEAFAAEINGKWLPAFWEIAKEYATDKDDVEKYASENHDSFLYNYYSYIIQMIWFMDEKHQLEKENSLPSISNMTDDVTENKENISFLKFAMGLVCDGTFPRYDFKEDIERDIDEKKELLSEADNKTKVVIFDGKENETVNFFKACCLNDNFSQAAKCYLWAYIRFKYYESKNSLNGMSIVDYYLLMRALFMYAASSKTPASLDKLSLNEQYLWKVVQPFEEIISDQAICKEKKYEHQSQYNAFYSKSSTHYRILNNPLVRGVTDNIGMFTKFTDTDNDDCLADNLDWIWDENRKDAAYCFKHLSSCGFEQFRFDPQKYDKYDKRVFLPVTKKMLTSLFSLRCWKYSPQFDEFINFLKKNRLDSVTDKIYEPYEWQFYFIKYDSFRTSEYGMFSTEKNDKNEMSFDAIYIANMRATKHKTRNPFLYEVCKQKEWITEDSEYADFVDKNGLKLEKNEDGNFVWSYNKKTYSVESSEDCIDAFLDKLKDVNLS